MICQEEAEESQESENGQKEKKKKDHSLMKEAYGVSDCFRVLLRFDFQSNSGSSSAPYASQQMGSNYQQLFQEVLEGISVSVHPCFKIPNASSLMPLLNLANLFPAYSHEHLEVEIMAAQSLMAARKFI